MKYYQLEKKHIDIHSHILPGVDDGAENEEEAFGMLRLAAREGIRSIIVTPHQKPDRKCVSVQGIENRLEILKEFSQREGLGVSLYPGGELFFHQGLAEEIGEGKICTLAGSRYSLVEFYPQEHFVYIRDGLYGLLCAGYTPVVAHAERYACLAGEMDRVDELAEMGCFFQINAGSLTGEWGMALKRTAWKLILQRKVQFVATDAHGMEGKRAPKIERCAGMLLRRCGEEYTKQLLQVNPQHILEDAEL